TFLNRRYKFTRNSTTEDIVNKLEVLIRIFFLPIFIYRTDTEEDISELTTTTGLLFQDFAVFNSCSKGFFISHLRSTLVYFYLKLATHTVYNNIQVQLTHTAQNGLSGIFIGFYTQCGIFFYQLSDGHTHFIYIGLSLRLNRN